MPTNDEALKDLQDTAQEIVDGVAALAVAEQAIVAAINQLQTGTGLTADQAEAVVTTLKGALTGLNNATAGLNAETAAITPQAPPPPPPAPDNPPAPETQG